MAVVFPFSGVHVQSVDALFVSTYPQIFLAWQQAADVRPVWRHVFRSVFFEVLAGRVEYPQAFIGAQPYFLVIVFIEGSYFSPSGFRLCVCGGNGIKFKAFQLVVDDFHSIVVGHYPEVALVVAHKVIDMRLLDVQEAGGQIDFFEGALWQLQGKNSFVCSYQQAFLSILDEAEDGSEPFSVCFIHFGFSQQFLVAVQLAALVEPEVAADTLQEVYSGAFGNFGQGGVGGFPVSVFIIYHQSFLARKYIDTAVLVFADVVDEGVPYAILFHCVCLGIVDKEPLAYGGYPHEAVVCLDYFSYFAADDDAELCGDVEV